MQASVERAALSPREFYETIGISAATLWRWRKAGLVKVVKVGGRALIPSTEVDRLLNGEAE